MSSAVVVSCIHYTTTVSETFHQAPLALAFFAIINATATRCNQTSMCDACCLVEWGCVCVCVWLCVCVQVSICQHTSVFPGFKLLLCSPVPHDDTYLLDTGIFPLHALTFPSEPLESDAPGSAMDHMLCWGLGIHPKIDNSKTWFRTFSLHLRLACL